MTQRGSGRRSALRYFASTLTGLGPLLVDEITATNGLQPDGGVGSDGSADIVFFRPGRGSRGVLSSLAVSEDVFVVVGEATSTGNPERLARELLAPGGLERALSVWATEVRPLRAAMGFRVVVRVLGERRFRRTQLRAAVTQAVRDDRRRWRVADPADLEVWVLEHRPDRFVAGLRLSDKRMRQHGRGRAVERPGALRPAVAAAMVRLAGAPPGALLDPCCGTGTIVAEARAVGWSAAGSDIDDEVLDVARRNVAEGVFSHADARDLPQADGSVDAVASNLPFGNQFAVAGPREMWLTDVLVEAARVTRPGGRVVVLVPPPLPRLDRRAGLQLSSRTPIRLLGTAATIWAFDRDGDGASRH